MNQRLILDLFLWVLHRRRRFVVCGDSMLPTIRPGDSLLIDEKYYAHQSPTINDIVLFRDPREFNRIMVKRVVRLDKDTVFLQGDNPAESTDSRHFGAIHSSKLIARVTSWF